VAKRYMVNPTRILRVCADVSADIFDEVRNFDLCMRHVGYVTVFL